MYDFASKVSPAVAVDSMLSPPSLLENPHALIHPNDGGPAAVSVAAAAEEAKAMEKKARKADEARKARDEESNLFGEELASTNTEWLR